MKDINVKRGADGVWYARPYLGTNAITKKPIRPYKRFPDALTETQAQQMANEWIKTLTPASTLGVNNKLGEILYKYVDHLEASNSPVNTVDTYRSLVRCYIDPNLGSLAPDEVRPFMITAMYNVCLVKGSKHGEGISPNTVIKMHGFLRGAWKWMIDAELTPFNPMLSVSKPQAVDHEAIVFQQNEIDRLLQALENEIRVPASTKADIEYRNSMMAAYLAFWNAERCGEICANSRSDANLVTKSMLISHTAVEGKGRFERQPKPKGRKSRSIALYEDVVGEIEAHYIWQESYLGISRSNQDPDQMICTKADGSMLRPSKVSADFARFRDDYSFSPKVTFHSLRHTHATYLLMSGRSLKDVQERLGHSKPSTTLGLYTHLLPGEDQASAQAFGNTIKGLRGGGVSG